MCGPQTKQPVHLKSSDWLEIFTDSKSVMARWSEYFQKLLNVPGDMEPEVQENIQTRSVNSALDEKPTIDEMVRAIKGLKYGKAPGGDGIPAEVWKYGELICPTDGTDGSSKYGRKAMYTSLKGCQHSHHLQKKETELNVVLTEVYLFFLQPARSLLGSY